MLRLIVKKNKQKKKTVGGIMARSVNLFALIYMN